MTTMQILMILGLGLAELHPKDSFCRNHLFVDQKIYCILYYIASYHAILYHTILYALRTNFSEIFTVMNAVPEGRKWTETRNLGC
jgi:hypothetical protein